MSFKSGGYRIVNGRRRENYNELATVKKVIFKFDLYKPEHCSQSGGRTCSDEPLSVSKDITRDPVDLRWGGWNDSLSGMYRYAWEVFKLEKFSADGKLREKKPLEPLVINEWLPGNRFPVYTPTGPGMYSVILQASDRANNSRYARRVFLYDNVSSITTRNESTRRLYVSSAADNAGNKWQTSLTDDIVVEWTGHFVNELHDSEKFLNAILPYPPQFADANDEAGVGANFQQKSVKYDDSEGERTLNAIPNVHGITKFEVAYRRDHEGGETILNPQSWQTVDPLSEEHRISGEIRNDGDSVRVWVRATDVMGNVRIDNTLVSFDTTAPTFEIVGSLQRNIVNGKYSYSSLLRVDAFDDDSGLWGIPWRVTDSLGAVRSEGHLNVEEYRRTISQCPTCRCTPKGDCFESRLDLPINNCWLTVPKERLRTEVITLEINVTNTAMLGNSKTINIDRLNELKGIGEYFPPAEVRVIREEHNTVRITWNNTPSCYEVSELWINYTGGPTKEKIHRKATFYDLTGLQPNTNYTAHLITGYNGEMSDPIEFRFRTGSAPAPQGLTAGGQAGVAIGVIFLIILIVVAAFLLWYYGIIDMAMGRRRERKVMGNAAMAFARLSRKHRATVDDDIYVYGGMEFDIPLGVQLASERLTLEEIITQGKFAKIYRATLTGSGDMDKKTVVAKMLRDNYDDEDKQLMKGKILYNINEVGEHDNLLHMLGAVVDNEGWGPVMVLEYCELGPLRTWLVKQKGSVKEDLVERLFQFAHGTLKGMTYLAQIGIVHRRLAARNILLSFLLEVRIAGFGPTIMSEGADEDNAENSRRERVPLRWMAPECFTSTKDATEKSDVWSFGIVLWEIFSLGDNPYPTLKTNEIPLKVKAGHMMSRPELADEFNYDMMQRCWAAEAKRRPKFKELEKSYTKLMTGDNHGNDQNYSNYQYSRR